MTELEAAPHTPPRIPRDDHIIGQFIAALRTDERSGPPRIGRGNLAALRRMDPDAYDVPAFWQLLARATAGAMLRSEDEAARWALIAHGMALMAPDHHAATEIGSALHQIDYAEGRLARLLAARRAQFRALLPRLCRHLASKQQPVDWYRLAELILAEGRNEEAAEGIRRRIASFYYAAEARGGASAA